MRKQIFEPLDLRATTFENASDDGTVRVGDVLIRRAQIYGLRGDALTTSDFFFAPQGYGAGGLYSSIEDLAKLFAQLDKGSVLKPDSVRALEEPAKLTTGDRAAFGLSWVVRSYHGATLAGHSGGPALADIWRIEDRKLTVIVRTNQQVLHPLLTEAVIDTYLPPHEAEPAIVDDRREIAANIRAAITRAAAGDPGAAVAFSPSGQGAAASITAPFVRAMLRGMGPLRSVELLGVKPDGERRYRLKTVVWLASADAERLLVHFRPE